MIDTPLAVVLVIWEQPRVSRVLIFSKMGINSRGVPRILHSCSCSCSAVSFGIETSSQDETIWSSTNYLKAALICSPYLQTRRFHKQKSISQRAFLKFTNVHKNKVRHEGLHSCCFDSPQVNPLQNNLKILMLTTLPAWLPKVCISNSHRLLPANHLPGYAVSCQAQGGSCHPGGESDCPAKTHSVLWDTGCDASDWPWTDDDKCCVPN